ncbi:MAG: YbaN family protein [Candidatus Zixiibacteriota bacterium]
MEEKKANHPQYQKPRLLVRIILILCGLFFVGLGIFGIIMPILPGYPFLLIAGACFFRSSETLYNWLYENKVTGQTMRRFSREGGMKKKEKVITLIISWIIMIPALLLSLRSPVFLSLILIITLFNTLFIIIFVKTV